MDTITIANCITAVVVVFFAAFALGNHDKKPTKESAIKAAVWYLFIVACFVALLFVCKCEKL